MKTLQQSFTVTYEYPVYFSEHLFDPTQTILSDFFSRYQTNESQKIFFVVEKDLLTWHPTLLDKVETYFKNLDTIQWSGFTLLDGGEQVKQNAQLVEQLIQKIDQAGIDRHSYVAAIGGGALLDMVGYAATITHRGVRHLRFPTTVLSQNDSGVGVKNAINFLGKKNFLGTFSPPFAVFSDTSFLDTLPDRDWRAGMSEAIKVALIKDRTFLDWLESQAVQLVNRDKQAMEYLVIRCAELHMQHIASGDPFERGSARPLDFGHWAAHKLEYLTAFELRHGEAVAIGLALDTYYSHTQGFLTMEEVQRIHRLIQALRLPIFHEELKNPKLLKGLQEFREHLGGKLTITLLEQVGKGREVHHMDESCVLQSIEYLASLV